MRPALRRPVDPGVQLVSVVNRLIRRAAKALERALAGDMAADDAIHEARRVLKRARTLMVLAGSEEKGTGAAKLAKRVRKAGRVLSSARDRAARVEALDRLLAADLRPIDALLELRYRLAIRARASDPHAAMAESAVRLRKAERHTEKLHIKDHGFETFASGLASIYKSGRGVVGRLDEVRPSPEVYHELRKEAKNLRHALEFLEVLWPPVLRAWHMQVHVLTDLLGEANDLTLVLNELGPDASPEVRSAVQEARIRRWRAATPLARRIWSLPRRRFIDFLAALWHAWSRGHAVAPAETQLPTFRKATRTR